MSRLTISFPTRIFFIILCLFPLQMQGRINFAALVMSDVYTPFWSRNEAKLRRALLETHGKKWFIENVINTPIDFYGAPATLCFIEGDYFIPWDYSSSRVPSKTLANAYKKVIDYLSEHNDTLYQFFNDFYGYTTDSIKERYEIPSGVIDATAFELTLTPQICLKSYCNYDGYDFKNKRNWSITINCKYHPNYIYNYPDSIFRQIFPPSITPDTVIKLLQDYHNERLRRIPRINFSERDAEELFQIIKHFDDYVLSLPVPKTEHPFNLLEWGYSPDRHRNPGAVADFLKEKGLIKK